MIERYTSSSMAAVWSEAARLDRWRHVEVAVVEARAQIGLVPARVLEEIRNSAAPSAERCAELEAVVHHDVVAFIFAFTEYMSPEAASEVHRHMTSSDVVDTAQALALREASRLIAQAGQGLVIALCAKALEHRETICLGRTHGQAAAPDVLGHRLADFAFAAHRALERFGASAAAVSELKLTGPVGTGIDLPPDLQQRVASSLHLSVPSVTTQVVFRDSLASWVANLAMLGAVCESLAIDVRLGNHEGVSEVFERRGSSQRGSSSMPHKRNPVAAEKVCGLARLLRSYVSPAFEDIALWQHRDISHSSVERIILPDASALAQHVLSTSAELVTGLVVDKHAMRNNLARAGRSAASSRRLSDLLADGVSRHQAMGEVEAWIQREGLGSAQGTERTTESSQDTPHNHASFDPAVEQAVNEVLQSRTLQDVFQSVDELANRYEKAELVV